MITNMICKRFWILQVFCWIISIGHVHNSDPLVNMALNRPVTARLTCGFNGPERFISSARAGNAVTSEICNNISSYRPEFMVDGNDNTWWQSTSRINFVNNGYGVSGRPDADIFVDLQQNFTVSTIEIRFGESFRPNKMIFYKSISSDSSPTLVWFYVVSDTRDCVNSYNVPATQLPLAIDSTPCLAYSGASTLNEIATFDFSNTRSDLKDWNTARSLKVEFYGIFLYMGVLLNSNEYQHYTVRSLNLMAKCKCNGQLTDCQVDNSTGKYRCVCGNYTTGEFCESCLPLYSNRPYAYGVACQACDCSGHADSCNYDATLNAGVCLRCQNMTSGSHCEKCVDNYYRPSNVLPTAPNPCIPCNCSGLYTVGGCLSAPDPTNYPAMNPGDCYCKTNVVGPMCDRCKDGSYGLNIGGCLDCACFVSGTVGGSLTCNATGQCPCKSYVNGLRCDSCMDGYYNLDPTNPNGCTPCACDVGGASSTTCDKGNGNCNCRRNVEGKTCSQVSPGYYYPDFQFLSAEMENLNIPWENKQFPGFFGYGYIKTAAQVPVSTTLNLSPMGVGGSDSFRILLRYINTASTSGTMTVGGGVGNAITYSNSFDLPTCNSWCSGPTGDVKLSRLSPSTVSFTFPGEVFLDRISAVPLEYFNASNMFGTTWNDNFQRDCNLRGSDLYTNGVLKDACAPYAFSLSTYYLNSALPCNCLLGANDSTSCIPKGGQCFCKAGTTGRQCGSCLSQYYNLDITGCKSCSCNQTSYNMCDSLTGVCLCPPGSTGASCETCLSNYYNWDAVIGCQPCGCNAIGSQFLACDVKTGSCTCKAGVQGSKCDQCKDGFKGMNVLGCSPCNCDSGGSISGSFCDKVTGNCQCKANVAGTLCNTCKLESFTLSPAFSDGCLSCLCMGITSTCSMSSWFPNTFNLSPLPTSFVVLNEDGSLSSVAMPSLLPNSSTPFATISVPSAANVYWSDPQLKGNMLTFYGSTISFKVIWKADDTSAASPTQSSIIFIGKDGKKMNFLISNYIPPSSDIQSQFKTMISMENVPNNPGLTRAQILVALTDVKEVLFPATFKSTPHQSSIGDVTYELNTAYVENCYCPDGYEGRSCESCSVGYVRHNVTEQGYLGLCKPCDCNGKTTTCDPITGYCLNCQQFTTGMNCETCLSGYYRDPNSGSSGPCNKCPCQENRVTSNECAVINSTVVCANCSEEYVGNTCDRCAPGYYGDLRGNPLASCEQCSCSGYATLCDSLGICVNCTNSTEGHHCEKCIPGTYKDPVTKQCIECSCNATGSNATSACDIVTGQCPCKTGITSQKCDICDSHFYNFSSAGCLPCLCNELGSQSLSCNATGGCTCRENATNLKCDACKQGAFGILNNRPCEDCRCSEFGVESYPLSFARCDDATGQCRCGPRIVGRTCNECELGYSSTTEKLNCTGCSACEASLGKDVSQMQNRSRDVFMPNTTDLANLKLLYDNFTGIESRTILLCGMLQGCTDENMFARFQEQLESATNFAYQNFSKAIDLYYFCGNLSSDLKVLNNKSDGILLKVQNIRKDSGTLFNNYGMQLSNSQISVGKLQTYNDTADKLWNNPPYNGSNSNYMQWNYGSLFDNENARLNALNNNTLNAIQSANLLLVNLLRLSNSSSQLQADLVRYQQVFSNTTSRVKELNNSINLYHGKLSELISEINGAITIISAFDLSYKNMMDVVKTIVSTLSSTDVNLVICQNRLKETLALIFGNFTQTPPVLAVTGLEGWNKAYDQVNQLLQVQTGILNSSLPVITASEQKAASLSSQASGLLSSFQLVQPKGQAAVDVINRFQSVVTGLLNAIEQARNLDATLQNILRSFSTVSLNDLQLRANQLLATTNITKQNLDNFLMTTSASGLNGTIDSANSSLQASVALWTNLNQRIRTFNQDSMDFQNYIQKAVQENNQNLSAANLLADSLASRIAVLRLQNTNLQASLDSTADSIGKVANTIATSLTIQSQLGNNLTAFQSELDLANRTSTSNLNVSQNTVSSSKTILEGRFSKVDELLKLAQTKLAALEQPVYFSGSSFEQITNPDLNSNQLYNSIGLDFSYNSLARGVLFFAENTQSQEKLLLQLVNGTVCFEFSFKDVKTTVCNAAQLAARSWFRVYITRYEADVKLTVVQLSTWGTLTVSGRATSTTNVRIALNSPIYVGGLAVNALNIQKVYNSGIGFNGCIYNVLYNGAPLPIWQSILRSTSTATCCKKPTTDRRLSYTSDCVTFYGFGYVLFNAKNTFNLVGQAQVSLQFRTFAQQGVIFVLPSPSGPDYYGIYIQDGKVLFSILSGGATTTIVSDSAYNNGLWFKLTASHSSLSMTLSVTAVNSTQSETKTTPAVINLASLGGVGFVFGGQHPSFARGPVANGFAGSIKDFQHTTTFSNVPLPDSLTTGVNSSVNVDLTSCLENVQAGLGFVNRSSYSLINPLVSPISTIDFTFITTAFSGLLFFAYLEIPSADQNTFLYVSLYNGDIIVLFNQGFGIQPTFRTRNLYLSNGIEHKVSLSFIFNNSPRMKVDNFETHIGAVTMNPYMRLLDNSLYIGGVPATFGLDANVLPVKMSFVGGIKQISLNDVAIQLYDPKVLSGQTSRAIYLSGIQLPLPPAPAPCNPCPTTTAPLACILPVPSNSFYGNNTFGFGVESENYIQYDISGDESVFSSPFQCSILFRSLQPDGLLLYVASAPVPSNYFAVYLFKGVINVLVMNGTSPMSVASKKTYYDGLWHKVSVYMAVNILAVMIQDNQDFNNFIYNGTSTLRVNTPLYIGGVPYTLDPFPAAIQSGKASFKGCLQDIVIQSTTSKSLTIIGSKIMVRKGVSPCSMDTKMGMNVASSGYIRVSDSYNANPLFNLQPPFGITLSFKTSSTTGVLVVAWDDASKFVSMSIVGGEMQVIIGSSSQPFVFTSKAFKTGYTVCNNAFHNVTMTINIASVTLNVDASYSETKNFDTFQYAAPLSVPIYLAGVKDQAWSVPGLFSPVGFVGCIERCLVNGNPVYITQSADANGALPGCT